MAPSTEALEGALRRVIADVYASGNLDELTVKRVRKAAEVELGLEEGFFKEDEHWREKSKVFISAEVEARENNGKLSGEEQSPQKVKQVRSQVGKEKQREKKVNGAKRKRIDTGKARKRRKTDSDEDKVSSIAEDDRSSPEDKPPGVSSAKATRLAEDQEGEDKNPATDNAKPEQSESEMSVLDDDEPRKRKRKKSKGRSKTSDSVEPSKEKKRPPVEKQKHKPSSKEPADPNQEEIKRLQGWLVKCGIRKMWWKELQPYESPKAKIAHLKDMLADAGMVGRYSQEKAAQIREERELKADLEAVQEGAKIWGKEDENENEAVDTGGARPRRQLAKGLQDLDFLNDDDGEETD